MNQVNPTIAIVDDYENHRRLVEMELTDAGYKVISAFDIKGAIQKFEDGGIHALVIDPGCDGEILNYRDEIKTMYDKIPFALIFYGNNKNPHLSEFRSIRPLGEVTKTGDLSTLIDELRLSIEQVNSIRIQQHKS